MFYGEVKFLGYHARSMIVLNVVELEFLKMKKHASKSTIGTYLVQTFLT